MGGDNSIAKDCIHCGKCTQACAFLTKYKMDLYEFENRKDLAYNCFLCGDCKRVCPVNIDGRRISIIQREELVEQGKNLYKDYLLVLLEKKNYIFKNYSKADKKSILFPGCNFLSYFPNTAEYLINMFNENDIGTLFECCGKPISELGIKMHKDEKSAVDRINSVIRKNNIEEIVMVCPNCYYFLRDKLEARCITVYEKLDELGIESKFAFNMDNSINNLYIPCPDRDENIFLKDINKIINIDAFTRVKSQCCGLGGLAIVKEKEIAEEIKSEITSKNDSVYSYCATCLGNINRVNGKNARHMLSEILGIEENSAKGIKTIVNRAVYKFK